MRVVHVIGQLVPGGSEKMTLQLAGAFRARGEDHCVVALGEADSAWTARVGHGVPITSFGVQGRGARSSAVAFARLTRLLRRRRPDVVQGHAWRSSAAAAVLGRALGLPAIATLHRVYYPRLERPVDRLLQRGWGCVVVDSEAVRSLLVEQVALRPGGIEVIPNFVAEEYFALRPPEPSDRPLRVLMAAHFTAIKGHDTLLRALRLLRAQSPERPIVHVDLVGDGPLVGHVRSLCSALELDAWVSFHGRQRDMPRWIAAADAIVLPSEWEGFGLILAEGSAASRPVISCAVGGAAEVVVDGETGLLTAVGDERALADALRRLAGSPDLCRRLGAQGRARAVQRYTPDRVLDSYAELYARHAGSRPS